MPVPFKRPPKRKRANDDGVAALDPANPLATARHLVAARFTAGDQVILQYWQSEQLIWDRTRYTALDRSVLRRIVYEHLEAAVRPDGQPFAPSRKRVDEVIDAIAAITALDRSVAAPAWLEPGIEIPASEVVACANGLLHVRTRTLVAPTPTFFNLAAVDYAYAADAPPPIEWLTFLSILWPDDPESIATLQEIFGYLLLPITDQQKIFAIIGPRRSGKGTIGRVLRVVVGAANVAAPTLTGLGQRFGLAPLIGRQVALMGDVRLGKRADQDAIVEQLLSISGEDIVTVDRKNIDPWIGRLATRFVAFSNSIPRLDDASEALASRFVFLRLTRSFLGQEQIGLTEQLVAERAGILNWALDGLDRLLKRGHFVQPASAVELAGQMSELASRAAVFVRECIEVEPGAEVPIDDVFTRWLDWCERNGHKHPGTKQAFGRDLSAVLPALDRAQRGSGADRINVYVGIRLKN